MAPETFIALRYLSAKRKGLFSVVTTLIGVAGVALGVAALIVTLSIMDGFQTDIRNKIIDAQAHILVYGQMRPGDGERAAARIAAAPGVLAVSPFALGQGIITFDNRSTGAVVRGVDPAAEARVNSLKDSLVRGSWDALAPVDGVPGIILGEELAKGLGAWTGDEVILVSPRSADSGLGLLPRMKKFRVAGLSRTGYYEYDNTMAYCGLKEASEFFGMQGEPNGFGVRLKDLDLAPAAAEDLRGSLGFPFTVKTYADMNRTLFAALKLEKFVMSLVLALIILVATFTIASNLLMMTVEKMRDIGILRAMGAGPGLIRRIFLLEGALIGLAGTLLGVLLGVVISLFIGYYPVIELPSDIYYITKVPVKLDALDILLTALASFSLCSLSALYPASRAAKLNPVDAIRYG
ncbi:MAG: lipoprotein-releasing system permease protein [Elusimicrobia bacterium]|nr:MAG: lipoprotein-releasing system permease protein [Elusimicrobiota bacterium]KAF0158157.1 MAG: lipoprotein-releasing system permease protein [Elusimicrobiota bacterium]